MRKITYKQRLMELEVLINLHHQTITRDEKDRKKF